jgi:hypothetical protein
MKKLFGCLLVVWSAALTLSWTCFGMSSEELKKMIERREEVTLIDARGGAAFSEGHIPGAINVPARLCAVRTFPPVGLMVVYGDGYDETPVLEAVEALNRKAGIRAEKLDGGFLRWEALNYPSTRKPGFEVERLRYVSYEELEGVIRSNPDLVILDVRREGAQPVDLSAVFPGVVVARSSKAGDEEHSALYVLVDGGDGTAERAALQLRAAGIKRFAILAGGEESIRAK